MWARDERIQAREGSLASTPVPQRGDLGGGRGMSEFKREKDHWLRRLSPSEWISAAQGELARSEKAWASGDARAGAVGLKRAAGMALNAALIVEPDEAWG